MKIIDAFLFSNEVDLLKYRLEIMYDVVDNFILVEAKQTFTGIAKELYYKKNMKLFEKYNDKIIHIVVDLPYKQPEISFENKEQWENEYFQRNSILTGLDQLELQDEDYIIISDVDEIPDPETISLLRTSDRLITNVRLEQEFYNYNLNTRFISNWYYSVILTYARFKFYESSAEICRHASRFSVMKKGGWHLSYFGDTSYIQKKLKSFSHQEYNTEMYNTKESILKQIETSQDLFSRQENFESETIAIDDNLYAPPDCKKHLKRFIKY